MNYIGGKYKIIRQIKKYFPPKIDLFVDLFCGGLDVAINTKAKKTICNDLNHYLIEIYREFQKRSIEELLNHIDSRIEAYKLSKTNKEGYLAFRDYYNKTRKPLDLFVLVAHSFNYQFRFNDAHEFNNPFGANRSYFNPVMRRNLIKMHQRIQNYQFMSVDFRDFDTRILDSNSFVYCDPPYTLSVGSYNDGKRGFKGWGIQDDLDLFDFLDRLNRKGIKFALSNVIEHKGAKHQELTEWSKQYNKYDIDKNYDYCNYQKKNQKTATQEVLITNFQFRR